ncbi:MAG: class I SAM-dependent methyltransferase [Alphaproteobacteria bacterium]|nr:class I SAM-dependent methyltransferase [Alphaproteobacteria bacterium]
MSFPFDLFDARWFADAGPLGARIVALERHCLKPPWPWGHWAYGHLLAERLPQLEGDLVECGVGRGGTSVFFGDFARAAGRRVYALDSFEGLPPPDDAVDNPYFREGDYRTRPGREALLERFRALLAEQGLDAVVRPVPGFFERTLSTLPKGPLALVHVDADLYRSVLQCLEALWPRLVEGGLLILDDFFHHAQGPARAASRFFHGAGLRPLLHVSFPYSVVILKGERPPSWLRRSLDGNRYALDLLRGDALLREAIAHSAARAEGSRAGRNARRLQALLDPDQPTVSADLYAYQLALEDYWDDMDADGPDQRPPLGI